MLKKRLIPVILLKNGVVVQSRNFKRYQTIGSPTAVVERLSNWASDELIYLDISTEPYYDIRRNDLNHPQFATIIDIIRHVSKKCFMPLTFGGGIRTLDDVLKRVQLGADKITLNTIAVENLSLISQCSREFGSQCIVVSIDIKRNENNFPLVWKRGKEPTLFTPVEFAKIVESEGAGEILLNSVDRDGTGIGFDLDVIDMVSRAVKIPVVAQGGAGKWEDFADVLIKTNASAVAAANIFHHSENSVYNAKKYLYNLGLPVRKPLELSDYKKNL
ncbi:MAG: Imidazole glycerol phosphate synthase subunit hisF [uncultured bacterium]|nr:MAG: Imidazole glycerol phosphate synthase subunit hisF [uncultured bacterium]